MPEADAGARQDERELADLGEAEPDDPGRHVDVAECADEEADEERLSDKGEDHDGADAAGVLDGKAGSSSMPTLTKKRRPKRSRMGTTSLRAWWLNSDSLRTRPATNAPSAKERPAEPGRIADADADSDDGDEE